MKTKTLVTLSLFVGIGAVIHAIVPPIVFGMKPDLMLIMMFLGIFLLPGLKNAMVLGGTTGIISAMTTGFPGGFIPNIIDKCLSALIMYGLFLLLQKIGKPMVTAMVLTCMGTLISGLIFLGSAYLIVGLPGPFLALIAGVVVPTAFINTGAMALIYPVASGIFKRSNVAVQ